MRARSDEYRSSNPFDIVAVATSLGGLDALSRVLSHLPLPFSTPVLVLQHRVASPGSEDGLVSLLRSRSPLPVCIAEHGQPLRNGTVYVAPPGRHLAITGHREISLSDGPKVNFARPSADVMFQSIAKQFGRRAIAVVLTGRLSDGAEGAMAIHAAGGCVIVQSAATCVAASMPQAVLKRHAADYNLPLDGIGPALVSLTMGLGAALIPVADRSRNCLSI
jgi:two-component system, chemotaxis family, protein-glutamate methylesterase/glutaminase